MNLDEAIAAHISWKVKLREFISGKGEKLHSESVCKDNLCDLGKWIYGKGMDYMATPAYQNLKKEHAHFHRCAAEIVRTVESGDPKTAETMLTTGSNFAKSSTAIVKLIGQLKKTVEPGE